MAHPVNARRILIGEKTVINEPEPAGLPKERPCGIWRIAMLR